MKTKKKIKFIDLFAGLGGTRIGLERALEKAGLEGKCVFTSEIKPHAISVYKNNFKEDNIYGDITLIKESAIPDFDILLAGFPCQPFSSAGARRGFGDTRGTLFFEIERILKEKKPSGFILENVEGLKTHDRIDTSKPIGRTLETILVHLENLGYKVSWKVLDASQYGIPQKRKRIYIVGAKNKEISLDDLPTKVSKLEDVLVGDVDSSKYLNTDFTKKLLKHYNVRDLRGKQIKDKRGGLNNIHSWDFELKGALSLEQKGLIEEILKQRRRKSWVIGKDFSWSDGMPLTLEEIMTFYNKKNRHELGKMLDDMVSKGYMVKEKPKKAPVGYEEGYNIVAGKLSFEISHILDPKGTTPTLVATDVTRLAVADKKGLRRLEIREGLRLFGFPEEYELDGIVKYEEAFDLLGNSVSVKVIELVSSRLIEKIT
ncbi:MAG TPA: DNA (cytosine-5-)-methyltransferase [Candidatus Paceibacterota bacterium]|nr:DNA (cytosine-5-)-methyltransferase [Candidatus Paceibacterota bacterium]